MGLYKITYSRYKTKQFKDFLEIGTQDISKNTIQLYKANSIFETALFI